MNNDDRYQSYLEYLENTAKPPPRHSPHEWPTDMEVFGQMCKERSDANVRVGFEAVQEVMAAVRALLPARMVWEKPGHNGRMRYISHARYMALAPEEQQAYRPICQLCAADRASQPGD